MKPRIFYPGLFFIVFLVSGWKLLLVSEEPLLTISKTFIYKDTVANSIYFISGMNIDADGSPPG